MAEARRACGYRKVGGLYLCSDTLGVPCCKLPIPLPKHFCSVCGIDHTIHFTRGWTWMDPKPLIESKECIKATSDAIINKFFCPAMDPSSMGKEVGLKWIGSQFYPTAGSFLFEAERMGISIRLNKLPRRLKLGETWVFLAHMKTILTRKWVEPPDPNPMNETGHWDDLWTPGIFRIFKPERVEKIVTATEFANTEAMDALRERDITPVAVPDNDKRHQGSVYDQDEDELELETIDGD